MARIIERNDRPPQRKRDARQARHRALLLRQSRNGGQVTCATFARSGARRRAMMLRVQQPTAIHLPPKSCRRARGSSPRIDQIRKPGSDTTVGIRIAPPGEAAEERKSCAGRRSILYKQNTVGIRIVPPGEAAEEQKIQVPGDDQYDEQFISMTFIGCFNEYLAGTCAWLQMELQERRLFTVGGGRSVNQPEQVRRVAAAAAGGGARRRRELAMGPQPLRLRNHNSGLAHRIMVKRLATSPHDPLGITDSTCKNQLVVVRVQYGPFNPYIPIRSTTISKSRVAIDPIAMHTSWRSNSDIASATSIGYPRMSASGESSTTMHRLLHASGSHPIPTPYDPKTNQYNQDLGLIHSTNGNHFESPKEGSSIDHQVTIYLHAQNITIFPTNETWYFASQILVSNSGGLILILTAQSTRNMFRIHSDY
ncbi:hypothetical protein F511_18745 [Dorcoceras hygrometricum]|uniref:Uncharacterized protein n=1 Tax=Dorcoceras hygrometricum TaxID=472368 RepID=A0A2Z7BLP1_9LAMI|nr:hypothetical protein F511_18745 [Dorcoceras hygrometricum]